MKRNLIAGLFSVLCVSAPAWAANVYSTGFEPTEILPFLPANLSGQNGWTTVAVGPSGTSTVQLGTVRSGLQAVQMTRPSGSSTYSYRPVSITTIATNPAADRYVYASVDVRYQQSFPGVNNFGPFFGLDLYAPGTNTRIGSAGLDAGTNDLLVYDPTLVGGIPNGLQPIGTGLVAANTWYNIFVSMDFADKVYHVYLNGEIVTPVAGIAFATPAATTLSDADLAALPAGGEPGSTSVTGSGFFDNYSIATGTVVPEPASVGVLLIGGAGLLVRRRRLA